MCIVVETLFISILNININKTEYIQESYKLCVAYQSKEIIHQYGYTIHITIPDIYKYLYVFVHVASDKNELRIIIENYKI